MYLFKECEFCLHSGLEFPELVSTENGSCEELPWSVCSELMVNVVVEDAEQNRAGEDDNLKQCSLLLPCRREAYLKVRLRRVEN